jgi:hypothetical protein
LKCGAREQARGVRSPDKRVHLTRSRLAHHAGARLARYAHDVRRLRVPAERSRAGGVERILIGLRCKSAQWQETIRFE